MRVVVAGAGLGGLCVANGLRNAGVDVEVLEARDGIRDVGQGYRININATGHNALRACLADEHFQAYEHTLHRQADPAVYLYSPVLRLLSRDEAPPAPGAIDRATVRRLLAGGLAGRVRFGRRVASIADIGAADLIVAADGDGATVLALCAYDPPPRTATEPYVTWVLMGPAGAALRRSASYRAREPSHA
jgi:2-polyprenyl-6-methoxyphenol hydroxylase-like FAD-dependent oxidoreductase